MATLGDDSLQRLKGLHSDLIAATQQRMPNIDRLVGELESRINEFRSLLDKSGKSERSRQTLSSGTTLPTLYDVTSDSTSREGTDGG